MLGNIEEKMRSRQQDEMFGCHQQLSGHEFEQNLGDSEGQGSPASYNAVVHGVTESDTT